MVFQVIEESRTADAVIRQVEALILDGVLRPGDRLPPERDLAASFGVSRPTLREALTDLERRGLVVARHGGGTFVADVIGEVFREPVTALIRNHPKAALDYLEFRREMDALAAGMAAERATDADRTLLAEVMTELKAAHREGDFRREAELDVEFHKAISECAHNTVLLHTLRACYRLLEEGVFYNRAILYAHDASREDLFAQHAAICEAILARDPGRARDAAAGHIDYVMKAVHDRQAEREREEVAERRRTAASARLQAPRTGRRPSIPAEARAAAKTS